MAINNLVQGFADFRHDYFERNRALFEVLGTQGQSPKVLVIACSDARVDPAILTRVEPGDLFVVRNVAALVPPRTTDHNHHGTSSAIEFAVRALQVEDVVVLGHALCGGIRALVEDDESPAASYDFLLDWVRIAAPARDGVKAALPAERTDDYFRAVEQASVLNSVANLMTFPWVADRVERGILNLYGWFFDLRKGELSGFRPQSGRFESLIATLDPVPTLPATEDGERHTDGRALVDRFFTTLGGGACTACAAGTPHSHTGD